MGKLFESFLMKTEVIQGRGNFNVQLYIGKRGQRVE